MALPYCLYSLYDFIFKDTEDDDMIKIRKAKERGHTEGGWLDSWHTFSFADYYDPNHLGLGVLKVINEDRILGGTGFPTHGHQEMEIISYVVEGALEHKDSMGHSTIIRPGEIQRMSAGTGITHSEYNHQKDEKTHFLQIWILPALSKIEPSYGQKSFVHQLESGALLLVASHSGREDTVSLNQDVDIYVCKSSNSGAKKYSISGQRKIWIQMVKGELKVSGSKILPGDGAAITNAPELNLEWAPYCEFILFDLP